MTIGYSPSPRTMRRAMRDQQVHVRSHGLSTPLLVGSTIVQWHEERYASYFYRPSDAANQVWGFKRGALLAFAIAQTERRQGDYARARKTLALSTLMRKGPR